MMLGSTRMDYRRLGGNLASRLRLYSRPQQRRIRKVRILPRERSPFLTGTRPDQSKEEAEETRRWSTVRDGPEKYRLAHAGNCAAVPIQAR